MNKAQILDLSVGRQIDTMIAEKVMGWEKDRAYDRYIKESGSTIYTNELDFSTEIDAAWRIVNKLFSVGVLFFLSRDDVHWVATFNKRGKNYHASADNAPLAICRAALLVVSEGE
jgi:hypothetical protein